MNFNVVIIVFFTAKWSTLIADIDIFVWESYFTFTISLALSSTLSFPRINASMCILLLFVFDSNFQNAGSTLVRPKKQAMLIRRQGVCVEFV